MSRTFDDRLKSRFQIKGLGSSPEELDLSVLIRSMYEASLLIYGPRYEEKLKRRFGVEQK